VEVSRRHGPFDARWPCVRNDSSGTAPTTSVRIAEVPEVLDWDAFSDRHFGDRSRHDSEARSAYAAYRQGREWRTGGDPWPAGLSLVPAEAVSAAAPVEPESEEAGARRLLAAVDAQRAQSRLPADQM
jgi:hypothetical protein